MSYAEHREAANRRQRAASESARDIGPLPAVEKPRRKAAARRSFRRFCLSYFPAAFPLAFSADHLKVIERIEAAVLTGGLFAVAMPRGSGKTTLCECACLWALVCGHRRFVVLVGSDQAAAARSLDAIKGELETNDLLAADFPEACYPVRRLERIVHRARGQTCGGRPTHLVWTAETLTLPTIAGARSSGATVRVAGLTGSIRGLKARTADGTSIRPDLVVIDDPQTDESARSVSQCAYRERVLAGAVLGLAGPGKAISGIMPCTVIAPSDVADRLLDPALHPRWNGLRCRMVYRLPDRLDLWDEYARLREDGLRAGDGGAAATEFYRANRAEMDRGAEVAWPARHRPDELSALQHAMTLRCDDPVSFAAEYQNEPVAETGEAAELDPDAVAARLTRLPRGTAPAWASRLTAFIDVQQDLLYWMACAWSDDFGGAVIDYGAWPDQADAYFALRNARPTVRQATGVATLDGSLWAALEVLGGRLLARDWAVDGGAGRSMRVDRCLVDANWGQSTEVVYRWCRGSAWSAVAAPSHGRAIGAAGNPITDWPRRPGERRGLHWLSPPPRPGRVRHVLYDTNYWKSFVAGRLAAPMGEAGALALPGDRPSAHRLLADHLTAEYRVRTTGRGREVDEWRVRPHRPDNHWLDCLVGCAVAAAMLGCQAGQGDRPRPPRRRVDWAELQRQAREARR